MFNHYDAVRNSVANTGKEHPQMYGDWRVGKLPLSDFIGQTVGSDSRSSSIKNTEHLQNTVSRVIHNDKFDTDSSFSDDEMVYETVVTENKVNQ